jgi:ABC-type nitrate/sulfonate/bicarbonate transport system permease component
MNVSTNTASVPPTDVKARLLAAIDWRPFITVIAIVAIWETVGRMHLVPPLFLPPASAVIAKIGELTNDLSLPTDLAVSLLRAFAGLILATLAGVFLGIVMAQSKLVHWLLDPLVSLGFPAPKIAFVPVFILWFGIESLSKILLVSFACIFPLIIATYDAAIAVKPAIIWSAQSMGSSRWRLMWGVLLPASYPRIFAATRVALPVALITTFTSEMVAGGGGLGATLMYAQRFFDSATVFAYIVTMLAIGLVFDYAMLTAQRRFPALRDEGR